MRKLFWALAALGGLGFTAGTAVAKEDSSTRAAREHRQGADQRTNQYRSEQRRETQRRNDSYSSSNRRR